MKWEDTAFAKKNEKRRQRKKRGKRNQKKNKFNGKGEMNGGFL